LKMKQIMKTACRVSLVHVNVQSSQLTAWKMRR
jgi:hypothetical protein